MSESLTISIAAACRRYQIERDELYKLMESGHAPFEFAENSAFPGRDELLTDII